MESNELSLHQTQGGSQGAHRRVAPQLVAAFGIGPDIAAELLVAAGDNSNRIRSEAALAKL